MSRTSVRAVLLATSAAFVSMLALLGGPIAGKRALAAPANDDFANATVIESLPFTTSQNISGATVEPGEASSRCLRSPAATVWYKYTPPSSGLLISDSTGSDYTIGVSIFTDSQFGLAEIACSSFTPRAVIPVEAGRTIYIQAGTFDEEYADHLELQLDVGEPPAHDDFAAASDVTSNTFMDTVDMFTATTELGEPTPSCGHDGTVKTVWYRIDAQQAVYVAASVRAANGEAGPSWLAVYQGTSLTDLAELACLDGNYVSEAASFQAAEGETYYLQASVTLPDGPGGKTFPTEVGLLEVEIDTLQIPSCAPSEFTFSEPTGDLVTFDLPPEGGVDVVSVAGGDDGTNYCLRIGFADPLPSDPGEEETRIKVGFDIDSNWRTGEGYVGFDWPCYMGLGWELEAFFDAPRQVLEPLRQFVPRPIPPPIGTTPIGPTPLPPPIGLPTPAPHVPEPIYASVLYANDSIQLVVPMSALGDDHFRVAISLSHEGRIDCVPNGGAIVSPKPAEPGDVDCDGAVNSLDATLILQRFAALFYGMLPCDYTADVNQNGSAGPIDAVLILQYSAGMIHEFTPEG